MLLKRILCTLERKKLITMNLCSTLVFAVNLLKLTLIHIHHVICITKIGHVGLRRHCITKIILDAISFRNNFSLTCGFFFLLLCKPVVQLFLLCSFTFLRFQQLISIFEKLLILLLLYLSLLFSFTLSRLSSLFSRRF